MLEKQKQLGLFSKTGSAVGPVYIDFMWQKGIEKHQRIHRWWDKWCFYILIQILVVALSAIFSYVYLFDIIFSVGLHSCHPVDHWPTYQAFLKDVLSFWSKWWVYESLKKRKKNIYNKTLAGNFLKVLSFFFLKMSLIFCSLFSQGRVKNLNSIMQTIPLICIDL